jgi:hypothetical protein
MSIDTPLNELLERIAANARCSRFKSLESAAIAHFLRWTSYERA